MQFPSGNLFRTQPYSAPSSLQRETIGLSEGINKTQQTLVLPAITPLSNVGKTREATGEAREQAGAGLNNSSEKSRSITAFALSDRLDAKLEYDRQTQSSDYAISAYLKCEYAAKRDAISQMVGIDTYV
ncbi:hypothetical protein LZP69_05290 [Shewanella sp. AS1]|nr:hypothetical protein [Shewanella sp. AS1]